jgi:hypothetical protein
MRTADHHASAPSHDLAPRHVSPPVMPAVLLRAYPTDEGRKYHSGSTPIGVLLVDPRRLQRRDSREVLTVSEETAATMDYTTPVTATLYRDGELILQDGHHRTAAAKQTGRRWIATEVSLINARSSFIQELIAQSNVFAAGAAESEGT